MARVLLVDDDELVRISLERHLKDADFGVISAANGIEALAALQANGPFDLVITDIFMPGADGIETIAKIRSLDADMPIVAMTGGPKMAFGPDRGPPDFLLMLSRLRAVRTMGKPFRTAELLKMVRDCLEERAEGEADAGRKH